MLPTYTYRDRVLRYKRMVLSTSGREEMEYQKAQDEGCGFVRSPCRLRPTDCRIKKQQRSSLCAVYSQSQSTYLRKRFTIQKSSSSRSLSCPNLSWPSFTSHLWNYWTTYLCTFTSLPPDLCTFTSPKLDLCTFTSPSPSLPFMNYNFHPAPPSITPRTFHSKLKCRLLKNWHTDSSDLPSSRLRPKQRPP